MASTTHSGTQPSGLQSAKEKMMEGIEKTRAPAQEHSTFGSKGGSVAGIQAADNPKTGNFVSKLAKGDTDSSNYVPGATLGSSKG
ncbi:hypothetical protein F5Y15DRAFT_417709 [Xylariaceae sp. FL0016]|nr:hypothetical protein F5Y15DRAFT_417709 [Xylariaceae sp. FL0016]